MKLLIVCMLACVQNFSQTEPGNVKAYAMDSKVALIATDTLGENIVRLKHHPKTVSDIRDGDLKMLKKLAVKAGANAVSVDLKRVWTNNDGHEENEYYILYLKNK